MRPGKPFLKSPFPYDSDHLLTYARRFGIGSTVLWLFLFVATAVRGGSTDGSWGLALSIGIGTRDPFDSSGDLFAVPLSILGWIAVPTAIGATLGLLIDSRLRQARPFLLEDRQTLTSVVPATAVEPDIAGEQRAKSTPGDTLESPQRPHESQDAAPKADDSGSGRSGSVVYQPTARDYERFDPVDIAAGMGYERSIQILLARHMGDRPDLNRALRDWIWYYVRCSDFYPDAPPSARNRKAIAAAVGNLLALPDFSLVRTATVTKTTARPGA